MRLHVIGTGSAGNAYLIEADEDALLLDAGLPWKRIIAALPNGLNGMRGCLITHEHHDHCKAVHNLLMRGVPCVMSAGTMDAIQAASPDVQFRGLKSILTAFHGKRVDLPHFTVKPFRTEHDAAEPLGYLIRHNPTGETLLYATDTYYLRNTYPDVNYWLVECNYVTEKARELLNNKNGKALYDRLMESHMSLEHLTNALMANDLTATRTIVLLHLSDERSDEKLMTESIHRITDKRTIAARSGMIFELDNCPF